MTELLSHAAGESWRAKVHGLNVLKRILGDSALAQNIHPYVTAVFKVAVTDFRDSMWAVRNSAMMAFGAVIKRSTGFTNVGAA